MISFPIFCAVCFATALNPSAFCLKSKAFLVVLLSALLPLPGWLGEVGTIVFALASFSDASDSCFCSSTSILSF